MSRLKIAAMGGALLLAMALVGCGGGGAANSGGSPPADDRPDAGLEASKSLMQMQPPAPAGKKKH